MIVLSGKGVTLFCCRQRVQALYTEGVELPSDYQGVLYTQLDDGGAWKLKLAKEMKAAGIDIDLNKLL